MVVIGGRGGKGLQGMLWAWSGAGAAYSQDRARGELEQERQEGSIQARESDFRGQGGTQRSEQVTQAGSLIH